MSPQHIDKGVKKPDLCNISFSLAIKKRTQKYLRAVKKNFLLLQKTITTCFINSAKLRMTSQ